MSLRRGLLAFVTLAGAALAVHCGFPNPAIDDGTSSEAGAEAAADVESVGEAGALPPDVDPTGKDQDAAVRTDSSIPRPEAGPDGAPPIGCAAAGANPCDCDSDEAKNSAQGCAAEGEKIDCDDYDDLIFPGQTFVAEPWDPKSSAVTNDWNCDGKVTKQFAYNVPCTLLNCGLSGFKGDPACGTSGEFITCEKVDLGLGLGVICKITKTETRTQGCK